MAISKKVKVRKGKIGAFTVGNNVTATRKQNGVKVSGVVIDEDIQSVHIKNSKTGRANRLDKSRYIIENVSSNITTKMDEVVHKDSDATVASFMDQHNKNMEMYEAKMMILKMMDQAKHELLHGDEVVALDHFKSIVEEMSVLFSFS